MCGIVGYIGKKEVTPILIEGLSKLEYRGYDSAGVAIFNGQKLEIVKRKGRLNGLPFCLSSSISVYFNVLDPSPILNPLL